MRLALLSWESLHGVAVGGVAVHVSSLAAALFRAGHEVHVFTRPGPGQRLYDLVFGVHVHRCPFDPDPDFLAETDNLGRSMVHYATETVDRTGPFDWVHGHNWMAARPALTLSERLGIPAAVTFHSTEYGRIGGWPGEGESARIAAVEREAAAGCRLVVAVSREVQRQLEMQFRPPDWKTEVIYHGVDPAPYRTDGFDPGAVKQAAGIEPMAPTILFVGRLSHGKGPDLLLNAMARLRESHPRLRALVVGEGEMKDHLGREIERLGLGETVRLLGWRGGAELAGLYRASDAVCLPSRVEPYGVGILNAWAAGVPVVAGRAGAAAELVWNGVNGWLVEPEADAFADALADAFSDFDRLRWMGRNGRTAADTAFTWDRCARQHLDAYRRSTRLAGASL